MKKSLFILGFLLLAVLFSELACQKQYSLGPLAVPTPTPIPVNTSTPTATATRTFTGSPTATFTRTFTPTPSPTPGLTPPPINYNCNSESTAKTGSGKYGIDYANNFVSLCDGWILYGDLTNNKVQAVNALYGIVGNNYQLSAVPGEMAYDPTTAFLYVILNGASSFAVVNMNTGVVSNIPLSAQGEHLAAANNGYVFVSLANGNLSYVNANTGTVLATVSNAAFYNNMVIGCSSAGTTIYVGAAGCSGCTASELTFNTGTYALTFLFASVASTTNGYEMTVSPDQNHVIWVNGGGNGPGYTIYDMFTTNFTSTYGSFNTGAYPSSAGFDPSSANLAATNEADLQVFSVASHAASKATWVGASAGSGGSPYNIYNLQRVRFSRGGGFVYGLDVPVYTTPAPSTIVWESFP